MADPPGIPLRAEGVPLDETSGANISGNEKDTPVRLNTTHTYSTTLLGKNFFGCAALSSHVILI
jgi:hypothetical protein